MAEQDQRISEVVTREHRLDTGGARRFIAGIQAGAEHVFFASLVARIEKRLVIAVADERIQLLLAQSAIEIDLFEGRSGFAKKTLRVAAGGSSGLEVKLHHK